MKKTWRPDKTTPCYEAEPYSIFQEYKRQTSQKKSNNNHKQYAHQMIYVAISKPVISTGELHCQLTLWT